MLCLICPTPDDQRPRTSGSDFEALFGRFVRTDASLWWLVTGEGWSPWKLPPDVWGDDDAEAAFDKQFAATPDANGYVASGTVFADVMQYLSDFWIEVYAFAHQPAAIEIESWWDGPGLPIPIAMPRGAQHAFANVDGSYWAVVSADESLLRQFAEGWSLARLISVEKTNARWFPRKQLT